MFRKLGAMSPSVHPTVMFLIRPSSRLAIFIACYVAFAGAGKVKKLELCGIVINPRRACAARVTVVVLCVCPSACLFVCLFVSIYSRTTGYEAAYERYQQLQCYKGRKNNVAILLKRLRSRDMA